MLWNPLDAVKAVADKLSPNKSAPLQRKPESSFDTALDTVFKDAGPLGALAKTAIKGVGQALGQEFKNARGDVDEVMSMAEQCLMLDPQASAALGSGIRCSGAPFSQQWSSSSVNGQTTKSVSLQIPVGGASGEGTIAVQARTGRSGGLVLDQLMLMTRDGRQLRVDVTGSSTASSAGATGTGTGGQGTAQGDAPESKVIDVEVF